MCMLATEPPFSKPNTSEPQESEPHTPQDTEPAQVSQQHNTRANHNNWSEDLAKHITKIIQHHY